MPFFPSHLNLLEQECSSYTCPTTVSCKGDILFSVSQVQKLSEILPQDGPQPVSPTPDLDNLEGDIWPFGTDYIKMRYGA